MTAVKDYKDAFLEQELFNTKSPHVSFETKFLKPRNKDQEVSKPMWYNVKSTGERLNNEFNKISGCQKDLEPSNTQTLH